MADVKTGRPSLMMQRRGEIVAAFIDLVARKGLEDVTLDDIAAGAKIQRSSVRHFVGNRRDLITAAIAELSDRYQRSVLEGLSGARGVDDLIRVMFSKGWLADMSENDRAFESLAEEATSDAQLSGYLRRASDALLTSIQEALRSDCPDAAASRIRETAYSVMCLVEYNRKLQRQGYSASLSRGAARAAQTLVRDLSS